MKITRVHARQIIDSRGNPTIEADVLLEDGSMGRAAVPSGASTGINEALELRDNARAFSGKGVLKAVENVKGEIQQALLGMDAQNQAVIDQTMITLDGTENKSRLGANAILAVSLAVAYAAAASKKIPLYMYINSLSSLKVEPTLPMPMMNIMNGGRHGGWATDIQEYMIIPRSAGTISDAIRIGSEIFHGLIKVLDAKGYSTTVGDEGGFAPKVSSNEEPLQLMMEAIVGAGYTPGEHVTFALDVASSEFFDNGKYILKAEGKEFDSDQMIEWLKSLTLKYPIVSLEDGLNQEDWDGWVKLTSELGNTVQIVGDDLFVTNLKFLEKGISLKAANAILIKLNQIGTLTETIKAVEVAREAGWNSIISHRSGETEDTTIAHLSVGLSTGQIKAGSLSRTDRVAKYNELLRIEEITNKFMGGKD